jgi:hypothetical protein
MPINYSDELYLVSSLRLVIIYDNNKNNRLNKWCDKNTDFSKEMKIITLQFVQK